ncbi:MAG: hypothetical protein M0P61_09725 [Ignavibacteriaceae bacterium]|nr:hypothetical protein [Ignavibacteriaceae bacterium]
MIISRSFYMQSELGIRLSITLLKNIITMFFTLLLFSSFTNAQGLSFNSKTLHTSETIQNSIDQSELSHNFISVDGDTILPTVKPNLLPKNMSLMEKGLWGENGFLRTVGLAPELTRESRKSELGLRRTMLSIHQIGGFTTLGLMLATCYYGQKIIDGGVYGRRDYEKTKYLFVNLTVSAYTLTGLLSILSPPPMIRRDEVSTTSIHKTLAWFHIAGMIATPLLGRLIVSHRQFHTDKAHYHQVAGYITTAIFASAMIVITF